MADETFRPKKAEQSNELEAAQKTNQAAGEANGNNEASPSGAAYQIKGNVPPEFAKALQAQQSNQEAETSNTVQEPQPQQATAVARESKMGNNYEKREASSGHLKELLEMIKGSSAVYEEVQLPSGGVFYDGENGPTNGIVNMRPMTGEEEQILATPRFVRKGQAINMIFSRCIKENYRPENFLTIDRTYLLIYLRGISYSPKYDVEIKCPECESKFLSTIDLNGLYVEGCPGEYGPNLQDVLPTTKLPFSYRLSTGRDEQEITDHRERRVKAFGDSAADDTLTYRTAALLEDIDGITSKNELQILLKNLPISDVSHIRNCINEPPFGVDTNVSINCPSCYAEFGIDLPLEANFFFPRRKKGTTPA